MRIIQICIVSFSQIRLFCRAKECLQLKILKHVVKRLAIAIRFPNECMELAPLFSRLLVIVAPIIPLSNQCAANIPAILVSSLYNRKSSTLDVHPHLYFPY